jgi:hypothetical protein
VLIDIRQSKDFGEFVVNGVFIGVAPCLYWGFVLDGLM